MQIHNMSFGDLTFRAVLLAAAMVVPIVFFAMGFLLFQEGLAVAYEFGFSFLTSADWNSVTEQFGARTMLYGTVITSVIATVIALIASICISFFLLTVTPKPLYKPALIIIQLLAAVPSIIYGMWGFYFVAPMVASTLQPLLTNTLGHLPVIGILFSGTPQGQCILTASLILSLMILPFITAMLLEILTAVPTVLQEAGYGLGSTNWEVFRKISIPYGGSAIIGAVVLGLGRALGEATAVAFVIGNATRGSWSLLEPGATLASTLINEFGEAEPMSLKFSSLIGLGFILLTISIIVFAIARISIKTKDKY